MSVATPDAELVCCFGKRAQAENSGPRPARRAPGGYVGQRDVPFEVFSQYRPPGPHLYSSRDTTGSGFPVLPQHAAEAR